MIVAFPHTSSRYRHLLQIGGGAMAEVILSEMRVGRGVGRLAVLKRIWPELAEDPDVVASFLREGRIGARLSHPNIVQIHEVLEDTERPAIAMEYVDGHPLSRLMQRMLDREGFTLAMRLRVVLNVLAALDHAHELRGHDGSAGGVIHRDVNPGNVIVTYEGVVKVMDFGLAKSLAAATQQTGCDAGRGRVSYTSPEQVRGGAVDCRTDVFAVGVMLWELAAGKRLWDGAGDGAIVRHLLSGAPMRRLPADANLPPSLARICARALEIDPESRFASAGSMAAEIERLLPAGGDWSDRRLGRLVSQVFSTERSHRRSLIAQHVGAAPTPSQQALPSRDVAPPEPTETVDPRWIVSVAPLPEPSAGDLDEEQPSMLIKTSLDARPRLRLARRVAHRVARQVERRATVARPFAWIALGFGTAVVLLVGVAGIATHIGRARKDDAIAARASAEAPVGTSAQSSPDATQGQGRTWPSLLDQAAPFSNLVTGEPAALSPVAGVSEHRPHRSRRSPPGEIALLTVGQQAPRQHPDNVAHEAPPATGTDDVLPPSVTAVTDASTGAEVVANATVATRPADFKRRSRPLDTSDPFDP